MVYLIEDICIENICDEEKLGTYIKNELQKLFVFISEQKVTIDSECTDIEEIKKSEDLTRIVRYTIDTMNCNFKFYSDERNIEILKKSLTEEYKFKHLMKCFYLFTDDLGIVLKLLLKIIYSCFDPKKTEDIKSIATIFEQCIAWLSPELDKSRKNENVIKFTAAETLIASCILSIDLVIYDRKKEYNSAIYEAHQVIKKLIGKDKDKSLFKVLKELNDDDEQFYDILVTNHFEGEKLINEDKEKCQKLPDIMLEFGSNDIELDDIREFFCNALSINDNEIKQSIENSITEI